jgi:hypothetical protein
MSTAQSDPPAVIRAQSDPPAVIGSPPGYLSTHDLKRAGIGLAIVMASAGLTYASQWASGQDLGIYAPFVLGGIYFLTDITRRWAGSTQVVPLAQGPAVTPASSVQQSIPTFSTLPTIPTTLPEHSPPPA